MSVISLKQLIIKHVEETHTKRSSGEKNIKDVAFLVLRDISDNERNKHIDSTCLMAMNSPNVIKILINIITRVVIEREEIDEVIAEELTTANKELSQNQLIQMEERIKQTVVRKYLDVSNFLSHLDLKLNECNEKLDVLSESLAEVKETVNITDLNQKDFLLQTFSELIPLVLKDTMSEELDSVKRLILQQSMISRR